MAGQQSAGELARVHSLSSSEDCANSEGSSGEAHSSAGSDSGLQDGSHDQSLHEKLHQGQRALRRIRSCIGGVMATLGLTGVLGHMACVVHFHFCGHSASALGVVEELLAGFLFALRDVALGLAPLPDDRRLTRWVMAAQLFLSFLGVLFSAYMASKFWHQWVRVSFDLLMMSIEFPLMFLLARAWRRPTALKMQEGMWRAVNVYTTLRISNYGWYLTYHKLATGRMSGIVYGVPGLTLALLVSMSPRLRQRIHAGLGSLLKEHGNMAAAATIAALIGDCSTKDVLDQAAERFRVLPLSRLTREDLASNAPGLTSAERTEPARFHGCDAFVSHSWRDDPEAKWAALQDWRSEFVKCNGREPRIWFDKLCIDQTNIEADLRCLPIFLSGCREVLVLCGPSYLSRLWCILEVFTFMHVVGDAAGINLKLVLQTGQEAEDMATIEQTFRDFAAEDCQCSVQRDKDTILSVIQAAFGGMHAFDTEVKAILDRQTLMVRGDRSMRRRLRTVSNTLSNVISICSTQSAASAPTSGRSVTMHPSDETGVPAADALDEV